jgi:hypothetical protein
MTDTIWATSAKQRQSFDDDFASLVNNYISTYKGGQPIMSWHSDQIKPEIHKEFLAHLPDYIREKVLNLVLEVN